MWGAKALKVNRPVFIIRAALARQWRQDGAVLTVLLTQVALGSICCLSFWWADAVFVDGAVAGLVSAFAPNAFLAWQQQRTTHASRLLMQSAMKWGVTVMLMALSFGVVGVNPVSFFVTYGTVQLSFVFALKRSSAATKR